MTTTTFFDTSALLALHINVPGRAVASAALTDHTCVSALSLTEAVGVVNKLTDDTIDQGLLDDVIRADWDRLLVVPVDQRCLDDAARLLRTRPLRLCDAIQFAAAGRLPAPVRFVTFDPAQIAVAHDLGFEVVSV